MRESTCEDGRKGISTIGLLLVVGHLAIILALGLWACGHPSEPSRAARGGPSILDSLKAEDVLPHRGF